MDWIRSAAALASLRPTAEVQERACTRRHASGCSLCAQACPKDAIELREASAEVAAEACIGCGLCVTACPVEAIGGVGLPQVAVAREVAGGAAVRCDAARILGHGEPEVRCTDVPCVAGVHPETLAAGALEAGTASVVKASCDGCPLGSARRVDAVIDEAKGILAATAPEVVLSVHEVHPPTGPEPRRRRWGRRRDSEPRRASVAVSRRSLFTLGSAPEAAHTEPAVPGLDALPRTASPRDVLLAARREPALPRLLVTDACTACGGCVRICPTDALSLDGGTLRLSPRACVGCGECARVCPEEAVSVDGRGVEQGVHVLQQVSHGRCGRCDRRLGPGEGAVCHACTTRASLLDGIWAQLDG